MPLRDQIEDILRLLEAAKNDLQEWVDVSEDGEYDTEDTKNLISEINSTLHDVGY